jgi:hypothetical protein
LIGILEINGGEATTPHASGDAAIIGQGGTDTSTVAPAPTSSTAAATTTPSTVARNRHLWYLPVGSAGHMKLDVPDGRSDDQHRGLASLPEPLLNAT